MSGMTRQVIVFGSSLFSRMVCALFEGHGVQVAARTAHQQFMPPAVAEGPPFVAFETISQTHPPAEYELFVALEHSRNNVARAEIVQAAREQGYRLASFIHPSAQLGEGVTMGEHCLVLEGVIAQYGVRIGDNAVVGARCFFGQQAEVEANAYFGSSVFVDRHARIGRHCVFGSQVRIAEGVKVADWTYLKAFEDLTSSMRDPVFVHDALRAPGMIVDRRSESPSQSQPAP